MLFHTSWKEYVVLRELLDTPGLRMTFLRGALEIMSPSSDHEIWKKNIARVVELHAHLKGIDLRGYGSTTFRKETEDRGAEPDECYLLGRRLTDYPDIVLEVIKTAPLVDKLDVYASMEIPEVWIFREGVLSVHGLDGTKTRYETRPRSSFLPDLDMTLVARFAQREDIGQALREFEIASGLTR